VAHVNGKLYLVVSLSKIIQVHADTAPYGSTSFELPELNSPRDIAAASQPTFCLFIMDVTHNKTNIVWKVELENGMDRQQQIKKHITLKHTAGTLSVSSNGELLIADYLENHVKVYLCVPSCIPVGLYQVSLILHAKVYLCDVNTSLQLRISNALATPRHFCENKIISQRRDR